MNLFERLNLRSFDAVNTLTALGRNHDRLTDRQKRLLDRRNEPLETIMAELGFASAEEVGTELLAAIQALGIRGYAALEGKSKSAAHRQLQQDRGRHDPVRDACATAKRAIRRVHRLLEASEWKATKAAWAELKAVQETHGALMAEYYAAGERARRRRTAEQATIE